MEQSSSNMHLRNEQLEISARASTPPQVKVQKPNPLWVVLSVVSEQDEVCEGRRRHCCLCLRWGSKQRPDV